MKHSETTDKIIKAFYKIYNTLGYDFLEKVYQNALMIELLEAGFQVDKQRKIEVFYAEKIVGEYYADIMVNNLIILEFKSS